MSPERYFHLLSLVEPRIRRKNTNMRNAISADERLTLTLRYLASGSMQEDLSFHYRISPTSVSDIVFEVCSVLWDVLKEEYLKSPNSEDEWRRSNNDVGILTCSKMGKRFKKGKFNLPPPEKLDGFYQKLLISL